jgi:membrane-associated phospholipid phosphatase
MDRSLVSRFPRVEPGRRADTATEAVNSLGSGDVLATLTAGMYLLGNRSDKRTAELAAGAMINSAIMTHGIKLLAGRQRPTSPGAGDFEGPRELGGHSSFPSGHTSAAFAMAEVMASRHPKDKWLYYGLASAVGFARVRKRAHFPSDVLVGAAVGMYAADRTLQGKPVFVSIKF